MQRDEKPSMVLSSVPPAQCHPLPQIPNFSPLFVLLCSWDRSLGLSTTDTRFSIPFRNVHLQSAFHSLCCIHELYGSAARRAGTSPSGFTGDEQSKEPGQPRPRSAAPVALALGHGAGARRTQLPGHGAVPGQEGCRRWTCMVLASQGWLWEGAECYLGTPSVANVKTGL